MIHIIMMISPTAQSIPIVSNMLKSCGLYSTLRLEILDNLLS
jgi:hypothetical protein